MNYLKTFFITTILLSTSTIFNAQDDYFAYTIQPLVETAEAIEPVTVVPTAAPAIEDVPKPETLKEEKTDLQKWQAHLAAIKDQWDSNNKMPNREWVNEAISLATQVIKTNKELAEELKSDFRSTVKTKVTDEKGDLSSDAFLDLIIEFNKAIDDQLTIMTVEEKKSVLPLEPSKPILIEEPKPEPTAESFPTTTELGTPESSITQTSGESAASPQEQAEDQLLKQWNEIIATIKKSGINKNEANIALDKANELVSQLKNQKTPQELKKEFDAAFEILKLRKIKDLHPADLILKKELFNRALFPEEYQQAQQSEQEAYQQNLFTEQDKRIQEELQKFREEAIAKEALAQTEREKNEKQIQAALALAKQQNTISDEKFRNLEALTKAHTQQVAANASARLNATVNAKEIEAKEAFSKTIKQQSAAKLANEQKEAANEGFFSKAIKMVKNTASNWLGYGTSTSGFHVLTPEEEQQEINNVQVILDNSTKTFQEKKAIMDDWIQFQKSLRTAAQELSQNNPEAEKIWIMSIEQLLAKLTLNLVITIELACSKVENALPSSLSTSLGNNAQIIEKIRTFLKATDAREDFKRKQEQAHDAQISQTRQERKEQIMLAQQKIKDEEDRVEVEKKRQLMAAADYKNHKQEWNQLLAQLSQNKQATPEDNHAHTLEALKKSHSLLQLAGIIPAKNKDAVSQKLKQQFTVALLDQQKFNDEKINIHHNMDHFNREINKVLE